MLRWRVKTTGFYLMISMTHPEIEWQMDYHKTKEIETQTDLLRHVQLDQLFLGYHRITNILLIHATYILDQVFPYIHHDHHTTIGLHLYLNHVPQYQEKC
jgi:hypothetical protein